MSSAGHITLLDNAQKIGQASGQVSAHVSGLTWLYKFFLNNIKGISLS